MRNYQNNAKWLAYFAPFRALSISAAYLVPFFLGKGLSQSEIFMLQSVFSLTVVLLEVPSGWFADRYGRALSIKISAPMVAVSLFAYSLSGNFWQFALWEVLMGLGNVLYSGADRALLMDSLKATGQEYKYVRSAQRLHYYGFAGTVAGFPLSLIVISQFGINATLFADGLLLVVGGLCAWRLVEPPIHDTEELSGHTAWTATKQLMSHNRSRWLIVLTVLLTSSTYFGAWLSAPYYESIGIPLLWFGAIYAGRSFIKMLIGRFVSIEQRLNRSMKLFVLLAFGPFLAMATGIPWLVLAVFGHDIVHALQQSALESRYNHFIASKYRAMLNSVVGLQSRLLMTVLGPIIGLVIDSFGLQRGLVAVGVFFGLTVSLAYWQASRIGALD